jgi:outer membrane protein OmpA-like peptidoglycan-associated protein
MTAMGDDGTIIGTVKGEGEPDPYYDIDLEATDMGALAKLDRISAGLEVVDNEGQVFRQEATAYANILYTKREERIARKMGYKVLEKYALILFEFDKAWIKGRNQEIVDRIIARITALPAPVVRILGHTDTIGTEEYNEKLSIRRAKAVYDTLIMEGLTDQEISYVGLGEDAPLYDNGLPAGRALNRTVVITIEYEAKE